MHSCGPSGHFARSCSRSRPGRFSLSSQTHFFYLTRAVKSIECRRNVRLAACNRATYARTLPPAHTFCVAMIRVYLFSPGQVSRVSIIALSPTFFPGIRANLKRPAAPVTCLVAQPIRYAHTERRTQSARRPAAQKKVYGALECALPSPALLLFA